ncbi:MAG: 4Fe-4S binding protein [Firmicutes bacterium]|nr:4Fe-4S binding protein [Bacillota bacterium]
MEKVLLGNTGIKISKVGFGVLTIGETQLNLREDEGSEIISYAVSKGINLFDTAEYYNTYRYMAKAFKQNSDNLVISSKSMANTGKWMMNAVEDARKALDRDIIDIFMLHEVRGLWDLPWRRGALEKLIELREKGIIKAVGISTHHIEVCEEVSKMADVDVVFPLINFRSLGIRKGDGFGTAEEMASAIRKCADAGKGVLGMKAFGGGNLTGSYREALDYVYGLKGMEAVMIGFGKKREVDDICDYIEGRMSKDYAPDVSQKRMHIDLGDCEGCGSCVSRCTSKAISLNKETGQAEINHSLCLTCGYCAPVCPERAIIML